jgi:hypothetical protein
MSTAGQLEQRLFRLCISLKLFLWVAILTMLVIGIWDVASGRKFGPPMALIWSLPVLGGAQLCVWFVWWRIRRARLRKAGS